jgi:hypothetical protein
MRREILAQLVDHVHEDIGRRGRHATAASRDRRER